MGQEVEMIDYYELAELSTGDASRVARGVSHPQRFIHVLGAAGRIVDPPELSWSWASTHPMADWVGRSR